MLNDIIKKIMSEIQHHSAHSVAAGSNAMNCFLKFSTIFSSSFFVPTNMLAWSEGGRGKERAEKRRREKEIEEQTCTSLPIHSVRAP